MKKLFLVTALILCLAAVLSACDNTPYKFYVRRALKIDVECGGYSLKAVKDVSDSDRAYVITDSDYVDKAYLLDPDSDGTDGVEFYNQGGLYIYMSGHAIRVYNRNASTSDGSKTYDLDHKYFRAHSKTYNTIERIWTQKYDVAQEDNPNYIVGAAVFDGKIFLLAQNLDVGKQFDKNHATNLWTFDFVTGEVAFCGFCIADKELRSLGDTEIAIVKNP